MFTITSKQVNLWNMLLYSRKDINNKINQYKHKQVSSNEKHNRFLNALKIFNNKYPYKPRVSSHIYRQNIALASF